MSAAPRDRSNWVSQNYDKLIVVVVLVAILLSALYLVVRIGKVKGIVTSEEWKNTGGRPKEAVPLDAAATEARLAALEHPFTSAAYSNQVLVSELRVSCVYEECGKPIPYHAEKCPHCGRWQPKIPDPEKIDSDNDLIPDKHEHMVNMNPFDPEDAHQDMDGDGFLNIEEFNANELRWETDPRDKADFPEPVAKLRVVRIVSEPFALRFNGTSELGDGSVTFLLNLKSLAKSYFVEMGETVLGYEVVEYRPNVREGPMGPIDESVLVLKKGDEVVELVKNRVIERRELTALMILLIDGTRYRSKIGDEIDLRGRKYKVIDIRREGVLIRDIQTGKETLIQRLTKTERKQLMGEAAGRKGPGAPVHSISPAARTVAPGM